MKTLGRFALGLAKLPLALVLVVLVAVKGDC